MNSTHVKKNVAGIEGLCIITPAINHDDRGYFMETYNESVLKSMGVDMKFVQDNQSFSKKGVLRGMHVQVKHPQGKLVRVIRGSVFDVAVDLRKNSQTFGKWYGIELSDSKNEMFYIPEGLAHGFLVTSDFALFQYKVTNYYYPEFEVGFAWNDPDIGIVWPGIQGEYNYSASSKGYTIHNKPLILSDRDQRYDKLKMTTIRNGVEL